MTSKTYLMVTETDLSSKGLTGAHKRFLELLKCISKKNKVLVIAPGIPADYFNENICLYTVQRKYRTKLPDHIDGMIDLLKTLKNISSSCKDDFSISFGPTTTICLKIAGYKNIVSLFREDLVGYQLAIGVSKKRLLYFSLQEILAVKASKQIIVQCNNDKIALIERNKKYCKNVERKIEIQINNANASWMNMETVSREMHDSLATNILFIGDFSNKRKGHEILFPAIVKLLDEGRKIELYIAGAGALLDYYKEHYANYPQLHFLGRVSDMNAYFSKCDLEIVPSLIDSCPNTVLEGLNAGIAVYGANTGGIPDLLVDNKYMFEPTSEAIYRFLCDVLNNKKYIQDKIEQTYLKENLTFNWGEKILEKIRM